MKIVSWNIWKGKYFKQIIMDLKKLDADIIGLQEVKVYEENNKNQNIAEMISRKLNYQYIYCKSFTTDRHTPSFEIGNAILSRYPIISSKCHILSTLKEYKGSAETEPRTAVEIKIKFSTKELTVFNTHLGYSSDLSDTLLQKEQIHKLINVLPNKTTVLMGDFNALPQSEIIRKIEEKMANTDDILQTPTRIEEKEGLRKEVRIDYIFTSKDMTFSNFQIHETSASDHRPLSVQLSF